MIFEDDNIWIRQSWLDTAMRCPERGRQAVVRPEWDSLSSDSQLIGTATHTLIESRLSDGPVDNLPAAAQAALDVAISESGGVKWTKYSSVDQMHEHVIGCFQAWQADIHPLLPPGGATEVSFKVPLFEMGGYKVGITGTIDYVPTEGNVLYDWKTGARKHRERDRQTKAIQPTAYSLAAINGGLERDDYQWPMMFWYGVAIRGGGTQLFPVKRTAHHAAFAIDRMQTLVRLALTLGLEQPWPQNDDHFLCNQTWCPWWSICKGAHITLADDNI